MVRSTYFIHFFVTYQVAGCVELERAFLAIVFSTFGGIGPRPQRARGLTPSSTSPSPPSTSEGEPASAPPTSVSSSTSPCRPPSHGVVPTWSTTSPPPRVPPPPQPSSRPRSFHALYALRPSSRLLYMPPVLSTPSSLAYLLLMLRDHMITMIVHMIRRSSIFCESGGQWHERKRGWVQRQRSETRGVGRKNGRHSDIRGDPNQASLAIIHLSCSRVHSPCCPLLIHSFPVNRPS